MSAAKTVDIGIRVVMNSDGAYIEKNVAAQRIQDRTRTMTARPGNGSCAYQMVCADAGRLNGQVRDGGPARLEFRKGCFDKATCGKFKRRLYRVRLAASAWANRKVLWRGKGMWMARMRG